MKESTDKKFRFDGSKLKPYLKKSPRETAAELGISYGYLRLILSGHKTPATDLATTICIKLDAPLKEVAVEV